MKQLICMAALSIALTNCQKKHALDADVPAQSNSETVSNSHSNARTIPTQYRKFNRVMGSYSCSGKNGNCLPDVIVTPRFADYAVLKNLLGAISTGSDDGIRKFFTANQLVLSKYMPVDEITAVRSGTDKVTSDVNFDGISNYIMFSDNQTVVLVLPVIMN